MRGVSGGAEAARPRGQTLHSQSLLPGTKVNPTHCACAEHAAQHAFSSSVVAGIPGRLSPWLFAPGSSVQAPGCGGAPAAAPETTAPSGVAASTLLLR